MPLPAIDRSTHWTDTQVGGKDRRRAIRPWANYRLPSGLWAAANTDVVEDSNSPPELAYGPNEPGTGSVHQITMPLDPAWFTAWRDATRTNNGWLLKDSAEGSGQLISAASTENTDSGGIYVPTVEVDYTVITTKPIYYARLTENRRR